MITVVVLIANAGSGKTTAGRYLQRVLGFTPLAFASQLKRVAQEVMNFSDDQLYGPNRVKEAPDDRYGFSPRVFLQKLGCAMRDHVGPDVWVRALLHELDKRGPGRYVIDDCRFPNELRALRDAAAAGLIKLVPVGIQCENRDTADDGTHESERHIKSMLVSVPTVLNQMNGIAVFEAQIRAVVLTAAPDLLSSV